MQIAVIVRPLLEAKQNNLLAIPDESNAKKSRI